MKSLNMDRNRSVSKQSSFFGCNYQFLRFYCFKSKQFQMTENTYKFLMIERMGIHSECRESTRFFQEQGDLCIFL